jgi:hypothetical protein
MAATTGIDATFECWVNPTSLYTHPTYAMYNSCIFGKGDVYTALTVSSTGAVTYHTYGNSANNFLTTSAGVVNLNTWSHIAVVWTNSNVKIYVNGVQQASGTRYVMQLTTTSLSIGQTSTTANSKWNGYISNARFITGTALYTTTFTPGTQPLTAVAGTSLLTCQSPNLVDNSLNAFAVTPSGTPSTQKFNPFAVVTQTPQTYSTYFDGSGDYLTVPFNSALNMGTGNFTIEFWVRTTSTAAYATALRLGDSWTTGSWSLYLNDAGGSGIPSWWSQTLGQTLSTSGATINDGAWHHIALVRNSATMTMYIDGTSRGTLAVSTNSVGDTTTQLWIGRDASNVRELAGYISNLRIVKGTALYTTTFTPSTTALTAVANTSLLTCQDATIKDNSVNQFTITAFGDAVPRRQNPFGSTTSATQDYSTTTFGGSTYFDGSSDYISIPNSALHATLPGNFTAECWFYLNNVTGQQLIFSHRTNGYCPFLIWTSTTNLLLYVSSDNGSWNVINGDTIATVAAGQWYHFAYTRTGSTFRVFLNGIQIKTFSSSASFTTPNSLQLGMSTTETNTALNGYISDFRFVNGTGVYTSNFVPPQAPLTAVQNTTLLLNMDKAAIADKSGKAILECVGDTKLSTAVKKYGSASLYFDGTGDYLTCPASAALAPRTGDFTIELWAYHLDTSVYATYFQQGNAGGGIIFRRNNTNKLEISHNSVVAVATSTASIPANQWTHIAVSRNGTTLRTFIDGVIASNVTYAGDFNDMTTHYIGTTQAIAGYYMNGYIDDLRITRGYARYTTNFTPPSQALITK